MNGRAGRRIAAILSLAVLLAACGADDAGHAEATAEGSWQLESGSVQGTPVPLVPGHRITLISSGESLSGTAACNGYGGNLALAAGSPLVQELFVTEMACLPEVMASEQAYLSALQLADTIGDDGDVLVLSGPGAELRFTALPPVPEASLIGTVWVLDSLLDAETVTSVRGEDLTLVFGEDGTLVALTGCRTLTGTYIVVGDEIETPELAAQGECTTDLEAQDGHVVGVFEGGFTVEIEGDRLTLTAAGNQGLGYRSE